MAVIIGSVTTVFVDSVSDGFQSVNWNINRQPTRLWKLGAWTPWRTQIVTTVTVSLTTYAGSLSVVDLPEVTSCADSAAKKDILINASACDTSAATRVEHDGMYITSYSYSKGDPIGFATESWSFQKWLDAKTEYPGLDLTKFLPITDPTLVLRGQTEGSRSGDVGNGTTDLGVTFITPEDDHVITGEQGSVSAGFPGLGSANTVTLGLVSKVGGGKLEDAGTTGQSSATIPHTPLYLG